MQPLVPSHPINLRQRLVKSQRLDPEHLFDGLLGRDSVTMAVIGEASWGNWASHHLRSFFCRDAVVFATLGLRHTAPIKIACVPLLRFGIPIQGGLNPLAMPFRAVVSPLVSELNVSLHAIMIAELCAAADTDHAVLNWFLKIVSTNGTVIIHDSFTFS